MSQKWGPATTRYEALLRLLRTANALWDASRVFFEQWDLSPSQFNVLNLLHSNPDGLSQTDLGRQLLTHRSNITGLVDRLEKRGLVERTETQSDRRVYYVVLSRKGSALLNNILPEYHREADHVWDGVESERINMMLAVLDHVSRNAGSVAARAPGKGHG